MALAFWVRSRQYSFFYSSFYSVFALKRILNQTYLFLIFSNNGPRMQSTQISENIESFQLDETKDRSEEVMSYFLILIYQTKN